jgi:hypothetical protein
LKSKKGSDVVKAIEQWIETESPKRLTTDYGNEFVNGYVQDLLKRHNISFRTAPVVGKSVTALVERANLSIRRLMRESQILGDNNWIDSLSTWETKLNKNKPVEEKIEPLTDVTEQPHNFKPGDLFRISMTYGSFSKRSMGENWSRAIYVLRYLVLNRLYLENIEDPEDTEFLLPWQVQLVSTTHCGKRQKNCPAKIPLPTGIQALGERLKNYRQNQIRRRMGLEGLL